jgi:alpha-tubulin suppressor-like RCC1 family protein
VAQIAVGLWHTCALLEDGAVRCWGEAADGQLGYANIEPIGDDETPADAGDVPLGGKAIQIALGAKHSCALLDTGAVRCWGRGVNGRLGYRNQQSIGDNETPASAGDVLLGGKAVHITAGFEHSCALLENGTIRCWGHNSRGQLGTGDTNDVGDNEAPADATGIQLDSAVKQIDGGGLTTCALLESGAMRCWGAGELGVLGYGDEEDRGDDELASSIGDVPLPGAVSQIAAGVSHTCALLDSRAVQCWGSLGEHGQLGYPDATGNIGDDETPASVGTVEVGGPLLQISAGWQHTCALLSTGSLRCWGDGANGALGYGNVEDIGDDETPESVGDVPVL